MRERRERQPPSCTECRLRKIKCDRKVPRCNSCILRGIEHKCRWGDERDFINSTSSIITKDSIQEDTNRGHQNRIRSNGTISEARSESNRTFQTDQNHNTSRLSENSKITEAHEDSSRSRISESPPARELRDVKRLLHYDVSLIQNSVASKIHVNAFSGRPKEWNPYYPVQSQEELSVDLFVLDVSLKRLPNRTVIKRLTDSYMEEVEPFLNIFNVTLWDKQMQEFWENVDKLGIITGPKFTCKMEMFEDVMPKAAFFTKEKFDSKQFAIRTIVNQSMIALLFSIVEQSIRMSPLEKLVSIGCFPEGTTNSKVVEACELLTKAAEFHFQLSQFSSLPTLWTIQYLILHDFVSSRINDPQREITSHFTNGYIRFHQHTNQAIFLAINLGLNRMGNGYDDAREIISQDKKGETNGTDTDKEVSNITTHFGLWMTNFVDGLAQKELGRKLWTNLVTVDGFLGNHLNQYNIVHEDSNFTAPPAALNDEDLLSPHAVHLLLQSNPISSIPKQNTLLSFRLAFARLFKEKVCLENQTGIPLEYQDLLNLDDRFHELKDRLPAYICIGSASNTIDSEDRYYCIQRSMLKDQAYWCLLHAHRLHFGRGLQNSAYRRSTKSCLEAAFGIFEARISLEKVNALLKSFAFLFHHLIHAALTFQLVIIHEMNRWNYKKQLHDQETNSSFIYTYDLADIDDLLVKIDQCIRFMYARGGNLKKLNDLLPGLEAFLNSAKRRRAVQLYDSRQRDDQRLGKKRNFNHISLEEASMRAGPASFKDPIIHTSSDLITMIPQPEKKKGKSRQIEENTFGSDTSASNDFPQAERYDYLSADDTVKSQSFQSNIDQSLWQTNDPTIWSLDTLFPNHGDFCFDMMAVLEQEMVKGPTHL